MNFSFTAKPPYGLVFAFRVVQPDLGIYDRIEFGCRRAPLGFTDNCNSFNGTTVSYANPE